MLLPSGLLLAPEQGQEGSQTGNRNKQLWEQHEQLWVLGQTEPDPPKTPEGTRTSPGAL